MLLSAKWEPTRLLKLLTSHAHNSHRFDLLVDHVLNRNDSFRVSCLLEGKMSSIIRAVVPLPLYRLSERRLNGLQISYRQLKYTLSSFRTNKVIFLHSFFYSLAVVKGSERRCLAEYFQSVEPLQQMIGEKTESKRMLRHLEMGPITLNVGS